MISRTEYEDKKPYYDFQRKKEYQRDWIRAMYRQANDLGKMIAYDEDDVVIEDMFTILEEEHYMVPPSNYVPDNPKWRIEGENYDAWCETRKNIQNNGVNIWT